jgi:hypothetical protein
MTMKNPHGEMVRDRRRCVPFEAAWLAAALAVFASGPVPAIAAPGPVTDQQLCAKAVEAWHASWERFYDERTGLFYDRVCSHDPEKRLDSLPTPAETGRQYPNRNGWGTGMEDCAISGGVMMSMICDRFAVTGDTALRESARKVFAGLVRLGTLSPSEGFVIRGISPTDQRSHYSESSRDQYTWYAYGLWRYYRSPLSSAAEKATMRKIITAICARLERNVVEKNDYHIGREDGTFDSVVDKMWRVLAHEAARLPMIYAIGADLTGSRHWRDLARQYGPEAAAQSKGDSTKIPYALLQEQVSLEPLYQLEQSPELKQQWREAMRLTADRVSVFFTGCRAYQPTDITHVDLNWRSWPIQNSIGCRVPKWPDLLSREDRTIRQPAEAALTRLLCPDASLTEEQLALAKQAIAQVDYTRVVAYGLYYTQAVYWRAARLGMVKLPPRSKVDWSVSPKSTAADSHWRVGTPIVTYWAGPPMNDATAQQMADGGWNLVWCNEDELDTAHRHGLRALLHAGLVSPKTLDNPDARAKLDALIQRVRKHPALYAYFLQDEPNTAQFPGLGRLVAYLRERDPDHLAYINLFPTYASNKQLGNTGDVVTAYREHLRQFVEVVKPNLLSYDHYHYSVQGDRDQYFLNLGMIRQAALDARMPFLNIVQACSWTPSMRVPNGDELRWLAYTSLAYGAQGLSYYVYGHPKHEGAMATADGTPTELYRAAQSFNREFVAIASQLQPLRSLGVYHAGMIPPGAAPLPPDAAFRLDPPPAESEFKPLDPVKGFALGFFGRSKPTHVVVVNLDYKKSATATVTGSGRLAVFDAVENRWVTGKSNRADLCLPPGGGALLRVQ